VSIRERARSLRADLVGVLALSTPLSKWERLETFLRDIVSTLSAAPVRSAGKASHSVVDAAKRLGAHLDQSNAQVCTVPFNHRFAF
jgi:hypothetical protein